MIGVATAIEISEQIQDFLKLEDVYESLRHGGNQRGAASDEL